MVKLDNSNYLGMISDRVYAVKMKRQNGDEMEDFEIRISANEVGGQIELIGEGLGQSISFGEDLEITKVDDEEGYWESS